MTTMYGIANCDTIKKAKKYLQDNQISFDFHDYKKQGVDPKVLQQAIASTGLDVVVNKRGTSYRKLSDEIKASINADTAVDILINTPSMIKRPILIHQDQVVVGFNEAKYKEVLNLD